MSMDVVADFCTSIRNAVAIKKRVVDAPHSKFKESIAAVMKDAGYLKDYQVILVDAVKKTLRVFPRYVSGASAINEIKSISTCGSRVYSQGVVMKPLKNGYCMRILSTSYGVMSDRKARAFIIDGKKVKLGGEVICTIW